MWGRGMCFPEEGKGPKDRIPNIQHFISGLTDTASLREGTIALDLSSRLKLIHLEKYIIQPESSFLFGREMTTTRTNPAKQEHNAEVLQILSTLFQTWPSSQA